jgi:hypothetical protein
MHVAVEQIEVSQEISRVLCHANLSVSPATSRAIALAILTSPDMMRDVFQTRLAKLCADEPIISHCRPSILKRRLGSRQVIAYRLSFKNGKGRTTSGLKVENPLAGMILPICCQFAIYARMSSPDLGDFGSMAVSLSEVMQLGGYTRILDGHL